MKSMSIVCISQKRQSQRAPVAGDDVITCCYGQKGKGRAGVILDSNNQDGR